MLALADKRGHVYPYEEMINRSQMGTSSTFEPLIDGGIKRTSGEITQIMYLPKCSMIALLSNNVINVVDSITCKSVQEIKNKKVQMFCVNNAIYANDIKSAQLMQQICVLTTDKTLIFYEYNGSSGQYKFEEDRAIPEKGLAIPGGTVPIQILWDNDLIYISSKKGYLIFNKIDCNTILQSVALVN